MTTLADFLLARIAEDEADITVRAGPLLPPFAWMQRRVLAECEAKRRIVELHSNVVPGDTIEERGMAFCEDDLHQAPCPTLRALAAVYADHSEYRQEWRA